jgi:hypothetical protein
MLPCAITFQRFQPIAGRHPKIVQSARNLQLPQLASGDSRDVHESFDRLALRQRLRVSTLEGLDHEL